LALFATAFLGFLVAGAVVSQVLYALVIEQRPEFGMLKAIGANGAYLCRVVLGEAAIIAGAGYLLGIAATWPLVRTLCSGGVPILLSPGLVATGFLAIATVCLIAAVMPLAKVLRLEPALVFRG
jgi:putative ABC transport system permease protein